MKKIIITLFLLIGTIAYGQTHGDVSLSKTADIKKHFTKDVCDKILTDTFTICYDFERKSPIAVYTKDLTKVWQQQMMITTILVMIEDI